MSHVLQVEAGSTALASLISAAKSRGLRIGWLELDQPAAIPANLDEAAACGVLRAVGVGGARSVAVKPLVGEPVLKDLLREYFLGCALVLVRGDVKRPLLTPDGEGWTLTGREGDTLRLQTEEILAALRRPRLPLE